MSENEITNEGLQRALSAAVAAYSGNNPRSRQLAKDAALVMPGGNTRTTLWNDPFPLFIQQGQGAKILDADGHWYVDFLGEFTQGIFGHSPEELKHAITDALERGLNLSSHNAYEGQLAELPEGEGVEQQPPQGLPPEQGLDLTGQGLVVGVGPGQGGDLGVGLAVGPAL